MTLSTISSCTLNSKFFIMKFSDDFQSPKNVIGHGTIEILKGSRCGPRKSVSSQKLDEPFAQAEILLRKIYANKPVNKYH